MTLRNKYLLAFFIPLVILLSMAATPLRTHLSGEEILLETAPYDPVDLFRGEHVTLNYKINEIEINDDNKNKVPGEIISDEMSGKLYGKVVYAVLKAQGEFHDVDYITLEKPEAVLYLKGRYLHSTDTPDNKRVIRLEYNLDKYFVPQNTGRDLENLSREGTLVARVKVYKGHASLLEVFPR